MKIRDDIKKKKNRIKALGFVSFAFYVFFAPSVVFGLEKMCDSQLKSEKGQAGLDIGMDNVVIYHDRESIKFKGVDQTSPNYVGLENVKGLGTFATGYLDLDNDGNAGKITVDIANVVNNPDITTDDIPLIFLTCPDWAQTINLKVGNLNWCGKSIGSLDIRNFELPAWHVYLGSYGGSGIRYQLGFRTNIEEIRYNYGTQGEAFSVKGLQAAGSFTSNASDNPADPATWKPSGEFTVGDALATSPNPASIDIGSRSETDDTLTIHMNMTAQGSIRASDIKFGTQSFGPMAIDGIKIHSMRMELPGRGLGDIPAVNR